MNRTSVLILIAYLTICTNVSGNDDCILTALQILRGKTTTKGLVDHPPQTPPPTAIQILNRRIPNRDSVDEPQIPTSDDDHQATGKGLSDQESPNNDLVHEAQTSSSNDDSPPDDLISFEQLYLDLKQHYDQTLRKLEIENDLLKSLYTIPSKSNTMHTIQTHCTCNVSECGGKTSTKDCSNFQSDILLEKVQEIQNQLSNISDSIEGSHQSNEERNFVQSYAQSYDRDGLVDWKKLPGVAVEISAKGKELWIIDSSQNIFRWNGSNWEQKPGSAVRVGTSPDGWTWIVNKDDKIYRWNVDTNSWDLMPGALVQISAISKDRALGVNRGNYIYLWSSGPSWTKLHGSATWAGIGDGDERWVVNSAQNIYRWNHYSSNWDSMTGKAINVDVQNPCRVIITNEMDQMLIWKNNNWALLNGAGTRSSITGTHYYIINKAHEIFVGN